MYIIYNKKTTRLLGGSLNPKRFTFKRTAKGFMTRVMKREFNDMGIVLTNKDDYAIEDESIFHTKIEKQVTKKNLISGKEFTQPVNTPLCCDPSSETYWSM